MAGSADIPHEKSLARIGLNYDDNLLTDFAISTGKYLDCSYDMRTEQSEVRGKSKGPNFIK